MLEGPPDVVLAAVAKLIAALALLVGGVAVVLKLKANGKNGHDPLMREIERELDALGDRMVAELREASAGIVARVDLNARERDLAAKEKAKSA